jgi:hypothetical protein
VQHAVEPGDVGVELALPVVALDLRRERVPRQAEVLDELAAHRLPVGARHRGDVRPVGAGGAVELAEELGVLDARELALEPPGEHGELLAHRRRRRGLAVGVGEQRHVAQVGGHRRDCLDERGRPRQPDLGHGPLDHHGVRQVVDVLARAREVDELGQAAVCIVGRDLGEPLLHEVLDGLHVVLGDPLGGGHLVDLGRAERAHHLAQALDLGCRESPHAGNHLTLGEVDQPLDLDVHAGPVQGGLTEVVDEGGDCPAVAPVERAEGDRGAGRRRARSRRRGCSCAQSPRAARTCSTMPETTAAPARNFLARCRNLHHDTTSDVVSR